MRLKCIKLAGFKSFVDPTLANFPSNMAGVVGPNGCGKSNVIDAVRWVMGESSAKQLRGDSMTDVIFNGSGGRKPVNQATIELVFDNSSGRIVGEYAGYNEISVRRRVTRDGQSDYFLNNTKCRRRDIMDIFLGTGLGPRSYSIIEQGMISNLITAKPEDLRVYLEEAAGISKYKERRRETENRIRRTVENLERLTDLREELARQLQRLQRQAQAAEKYKEYRQEERGLKKQLLALRWDALNKDAGERQQKIAEVELEVEKAVLGELECNTQIEKIRESHASANENFNGIQTAYYESGAEIARIEQDIHHREERVRQLRSDIEQTEQSYAEATRHFKEDSLKAEAWQAELEELARQKTEADAVAKESLETLTKAESEMSEWQQQWDEFQQTSAATKREADVQQSSIQYLEKSIASLSERQERLKTQGGGEADIAALAGDINSAEIAQAEIVASFAIQSEKEEAGVEAVQNMRKKLSSYGSELDDARSELHSARGRMASLQALQQAALEDTEEGAEVWLSAQNLSQSPRIAESMEVESGWEKAVETVLGQSLKAVCVDDIEQLAKQFGSFEDGQVEIVDSSVKVKALGNTLASKVVRGEAARSLLSGILVADDLADAFRIKSSLKPGESIVTPEGLWIGENWCRLSKGQLTTSGVLERKSEIEALESSIAQLEKNELEKRQQIEAGQAELLQQEEGLRGQRREKDLLSGKLADIKAQYSAVTAKKDQLARQLEHNRKDLDTTLAQFTEQEAQLGEARRLLAEAIDKMEKQSGHLTELQGGREVRKSAEVDARSKYQQAAQSVQQLDYREQTVTTQRQSILESIERLRVQLNRLEERRVNLKDTPSEVESDPIVELRTELEHLLEKRLKVEQEMTAARQQLQDIEHQLQELERSRQEIQHKLGELREQLSERRLQAQEVLTRRETIVEQLEDGKPEDILAELPEEATESSWQEQLERIENRIQRLGPINLAAIDEFGTESERKDYLDAQNEELESALTTLRDAISKIDKETRTRFKETFDKVNAGVKELFPKLFGGGHAYLELTSDDYLETGVTIMARPPGKRNSTIHLLSGGEKAMTAISLVFSIFQLNPAPFCMLDEVDAPLDDANCGRFASMVKEMSEKVQFIFITHNKITMEQANQLMGVTMHEPGVSRLVSVDVEEAIELAAV